METSGGVVPDLFVACEPDACEGVVNMGCTYLGDEEHLVKEETAFGSLSNAQCYYAKTSTIQPGAYRFAQSLLFLGEPAFRQAVTSGAYDFVLRVDADSVLLPGLLWLHPEKHDAWLGEGFLGVPLTFAQLGKFTAEEMGLQEVVPNAFTERSHLQSSFYVRADQALAFCDRLLKAIEVLRERAFTEKKCAELEASPEAKELAPGKHNLCRWPYWFRDNSALYGTSIAANTLFEEILVTDMLDALAAPIRKEYTTKADYLVQAHLIQQKHALLKEAIETKDALCTHKEKYIAQALASHRKKRVRLIFQAFLAEDPDESSVYYYIADIFLRAVQDRYCPDFADRMPAGQKEFAYLV
ncbi:Hypothetical Protein FCC1311_110152 [Hondaea fermentalgiana]|uniref:DUF7164 domain-containing protein n=1 Tax=Hondaea fermentalgiana TaxID=2315210 RepID=A0A2R5H138_9STRA|nr:Hypothetical Protein FCC1311_110152 [Hondaea fermentalgiana]|eukprot:GBG34793.1 Hypothetical Protein FCC1311_110152 [Hondaea fermentalgiana]